ncbi:hypothetical protein ACFYTC_37415 [Actinomadura nitritigenes]|uniref:hypothetical protein n=1 Tax=Actinomadura nitritigenes TaxID=134602 RepID=UPI0036A2B1BC
MTSDDWEQRSDGTYIKLGRQPVLLPPALDRLITAQASATAPSMIGRVTPSSTSWLFPGRLCGRCVTPLVLARRLNAHGIDIRAARNTAVLALASDLPAPILSKILGVHINTAVDWVRYAGRDWSSYLTARSHGLHPKEYRTLE